MAVIAEGMLTWAAGGHQIVFAVDHLPLAMPHRRLVPRLRAGLAHLSSPAPEKAEWLASCLEG